MGRRKGKKGIYTLSDPETGDVRYVGLTTDSIRREWLHGNLSNNMGGRRINRWIRGLLNRGLKPVFAIIEETDFLSEREQHWIAHYRSSGHDLLNMNAGGHDNEHMLGAPRGNRGRPMDPLHRKVIELRKNGLRFARERGNLGLEAHILAALSAFQNAQKRLAKQLGSRSAANAELNRRYIERQSNAVRE